MKVVVFGASGGTGCHIVDQALEAGYEVTAFVRSPEKLGIEHCNLTIFQGDVMDAESVERAIAGQDAVLSVLGPTRPPVPDMMATAAENIVAALVLVAELLPIDFEQALEELAIHHLDGRAVLGTVGVRKSIVEPIVADERCPQRIQLELALEMLVEQSVQRRARIDTLRLFRSRRLFLAPTCREHQ